jgi:hypothetical protein
MGLHEDEDRQFAAEVQAVQNWWKDSRWRYTKRPFTAEQIVAKRGNLKIDYPSNVQAKKLWKIVESNFQVGVGRSWLWSTLCRNMLTLQSMNRTSRPALPTAASSLP